MTQAAAAAQAARPHGRGPLFACLAFAEWTKLRTLRSGYWTLLAAAIAMTGFGPLLCAAYARHLTPASRAALDPAAYSESGFFLAQMAIGVLGALIRRTAGAIAILIALVIFPPVSVGALPAAWQNDAGPYLPSVAGQAVIGATKFTPPGNLLSPWTGFAVFCGYSAAVLAAAAITLHRRDP